MSKSLSTAALAGLPEGAEDDQNRFCVLGQPNPLDDEASSISDEDGLSRPDVSGSSVASMSAQTAELTFSGGIALFTKTLVLSNVKAWEIKMAFVSRKACKEKWESVKFPVPAGYQ